MQQARNYVEANEANASHKFFRLSDIFIIIIILAYLFFIKLKILIISTNNLPENAKLYSTKCILFSLKCTQIVGGWGSAPDPAEGASSAPSDYLAVMGWDRNKTGIKLFCELLGLHTLLKIILKFRLQ